MKIKNVVSFLGFLVLCFGIYFGINVATKIESFTPNSESINTNSEKLNQNKKVLLINTQKGFGGGEIYTLSLYKNLLKKDLNVSMLVLRNSWLEKELIKEKLPYFAAYSFYFNFKSNLLELCKKEKIDLIHCNVAREVPAAKYVKSILPLKVVFTKHIPNPYDPKITKDLDGLIAVSNQIKYEMIEKNKTEQLDIKKISRITPFFEEEKFLTFKTNKIKNEFYLKNFGITLKELPLVCCIANMARDKNQNLLIEALSICVHKKSMPFEVVLAGDGKQLSRVKALAKKLNVSEYVHFLGHTRKIPSILNFADVIVNTSIREGFPISILEACYMKKPIIITDSTGAADMIINEQTGLQVKNNDAQDLANALEKLINNSELRKTYAENVFNFVRQNFSTEIVLNQLEEFYKEVLSTKNFTNFRTDLA